MQREAKTRHKGLNYAILSLTHGRDKLQYTQSLISKINSVFSYTLLHMKSVLNVCNCCGGKKQTNKLFCKLCLQIDLHIRFGMRMTHSFLFRSPLLLLCLVAMPT